MLNRPLCQGKQLNQINEINQRCPRSGVLLDQQRSLQQQFEDLCSNSSFQTLLDIFKGSSQPFFATDSYFVENYQKEASMYYGLTFLNGMHYSLMSKMSYEQLNQIIESAFAHTTSNSKTLTEIISHFIECNKGVEVMSNILGLDYQIFASFFELAMNI